MFIFQLLISVVVLYCMSSSLVAVGKEKNNKLKRCHQSEHDEPKSTENKRLKQAYEKPQIIEQSAYESFMQALQASSVKAVEEYLSDGVDPNKLLMQLKIKSGNNKIAVPVTPLCFTSSRGNPEMVKLLLEHGADPNIAEAQTLHTPLHIACFKSQRNPKRVSDFLTVINLLLKYNADPNKLGKSEEFCLDIIANSGISAAFRSLLKYHVDSTSSFRFNCTSPLITACIKQDWSQALMLLSFGCDPNELAPVNTLNAACETETRRLSALQIAAEIFLYQGRSKESKSIVKLLLTYGADASSIVLGERPDFKSSLYLVAHSHGKQPFPSGRSCKPMFHSYFDIAAYKGESDKIEVLSPMLPNPMTTNFSLSGGQTKELTPIHWAAAAGHLAIIKQLLHYEPSLLNCRKQGLTPLDLALCNKQTSCVHFLESKGATCSRYNPLWQAVHTHDSVRINKLLEQENPDQNKQDMYGNTAAHKAAVQPNTPFLNLLLRNGADLTIKNNLGITPLELLSSNKDAGDVRHVGEKILGPLLIVLGRSETPEVRAVGNVTELMYYLGGFLAQAHYLVPNSEAKLPIKKVLLLDTYAALKATASMR